MNKQILLTLTVSLVLAVSATAQVPSYVPTDGLVGYWPFNGNAEDASGNGNHGVVNGALLTTDRNANENSAYHFNGIDNGISVDFDTLKRIDSVMTFASWFKHNDALDFISVAAFDYKAILIHPRLNNQIRAYGSNDSYVSTNEKTVETNVWNHLSVVYTKNYITLYVNGQLINNISINLNSPYMPITTLMLIGHYHASWYKFSGSLDDIGIWNRALTPEEVEQLYTGQIKQTCLPSYVPTDSLVGYWPFCGNANDESGNGNHGVVNGATLTTDRFGNKEKAFSFDGVNDEISIGNLNVNGNWAISFFSLVSNFNPEVQYQIGLEDIGCCGAGIGTTGEVNGCAAPPRKLFIYDGNSGCANAVYSDVSLNQNKWFHSVIVNNNGVYKIYIDGILMGSSSNLNDLNLTNVLFGRRNGPDKRFFNGSLDDIGIWNRALSPEEIEKLYNDSNKYSCDLSDILNPAVDYGKVTDFDGNVYPTVKIGEQEWMADNLRTTRYQNGDKLENVSMILFRDMKVGTWIHMLENPEYDCPYGKLYNWYAASDPRNICPEDWHVANDSDWNELFYTLGGQGPALTKLKSPYGGFLPSNSTNESGFSAIAAGFLWPATAWQQPQLVFLSNTVIDDQRTKRLVMNEAIFIGEVPKSWGHSIRCVKDRPNQCNLIEKVDPAIRTTVSGSTISFNAEYNTNNATYQWQSNTASTGWADISPSSAYVGVNTTKLTIQSAQISNHLQKIRLVATNGTCFDTSNVATVFITDTCLVTLTDTILTTVTDTLVIDVVLSNTTDPSGTSIKVYPNPTSSQLVIETGNASLLTGYTITITNGAGATVWTEAVSQPLYSLDLSSWGGKGLYYITLTDAQGKVVTTRKIVLQ